MTTPRHTIVLDSVPLTEATADHPAAAGEPTWDAVAALGALTTYPRTRPADVAERARGADCVLTNKVVLTPEILDPLPDLRYVGVLATGTNIIDLDDARRRGITVTNVPGYSTDSVAQHVFAMLLELASRTSLQDAAVHRGDWANCDDFSFIAAPLTELSGKTLGIVGLGGIGKRVAKIGHAMGMKIAAAHQRSMDRTRIHGIDIHWMPHDQLFAEADAITLHCPLTEETQQMVNAERLETMKSSAFLINTGRGPLIDEAALRNALDAGQIAGAGLDVLSTEPPSADNPLLHAKNCVITPHTAWATQEARGRLMAIASANLERFLAGEPQNVVNA